MKSKLIILLLSSLSFVFASDYDNKNILSSAYNSVKGAIVESFGDEEFSGSEIAFTYKPTPINLTFNYTSTDADVDEIAGKSAFDIKRESDSFQLRYLIEGNGDYHLIPFISTGSLKYSILGNNIEADATTFGFLFRYLAGENTIHSIGLAYVDYDDTSIPGDIRSSINSELTNRVKNTYSDADFDSIENSAVSDKTILSFDIEYHVTENLSIDYGLATDFDSTSLSFGIGLNY